EQRGLLTPVRTQAGWRTYGPEQMSRASEIAALRALGFSLAQVARVLKGDPQGLEPTLAAHQTTLEARLRDLVAAVEKVRGLRCDLARGCAPTVGDLARLLAPAPGLNVAFDLPWPWGGERFALHDIRPLNYITGPLGSGKTRLATCLADSLGDVFVGLDRRTRDDHADPALKARVDRTVALLVEDGGTQSAALTALLTHLESAEPAILVIDMLEQG